MLKNAEEKLKNSGHSSETELVDVNKKKGDDFEKYVVKKFNPKYFTIKEWAGDKYVEGLYAETTPQPDLLIEFKNRDVSELFSVECKWRNNLYKKGIEFANPKQFLRYKKYEKEQKIPVFIAIGLGGTATDPEKLYIIPLSDLETNFISSEILKKFKKTDNKGWFYDWTKKSLK